MLWDDSGGILKYGASVFLYDDMCFISDGRMKRFSAKDKKRTNYWVNQELKRDKKTDLSLAKIHTQLLVNHLHIGSKKRALQIVTLVNDAWQKKYPKIHGNLECDWRQPPSGAKKEMGNAVILSWWLSPPLAGL